MRSDVETLKGWLHAAADAVNTKTDAERIAELEAAAKSALAQLNSIMDVRMPGHAAGALVHARETLKSVVQ